MSANEYRPIGLSVQLNKLPFLLRDLKEKHSPFHLVEIAAMGSDEDYVAVKLTNEQAKDLIEKIRFEGLEAKYG